VSDSPNPYAPPSAGATTASKGARRAPGGSITVAFAFVSATTAVASGALVVAPYVGLPRGLTLLVAASTTYLAWGRIGLALAWIHQSWQGLPETRNPDRPTTTPGQAVGFFFIPVYGIYWMFRGNLLLCDALDSALADAGRDRPRAPRDLALLAAAVQLVAPIMALAHEAVGFHVAVIASTGAWLAYMVRADRVQRALGPARRRRRRTKKRDAEDGGTRA